MSTLAVLTPSYAPDLELCRDLNRSVLTWTDSDVQHHIIVPRRDRSLFAALSGDRTHVWPRTSFSRAPCWRCLEPTRG